MKYILSITLFVGISICTQQKVTAQTYFTNTGVITNDSNWNIFSINVTNPLFPLCNGSYGLEEVCVSINHPMVQELILIVISPDASIYQIYNGNAVGANFNGACFNAVGVDIGASWPPYMGDFIPNYPLGVFNNGQPTAGSWLLVVIDKKQPNNAGTLTSCSFKFSTNPSPPFSFDSTNLPIVKIETNGVIIVDDPKIPASIGIIDNGAGIFNHPTDTFTFKHKIGIETRGASSAILHPQIPYGFETWDSLNNEIDTSILGLPPESDWILYSPQNDRSLMRNVLTYHLANQMGHYASRTRFVELMLNGSYKGVYVLMERIKRDKNRVDIAKLTNTDTAGVNLTGGYILKTDWCVNGSCDGFYSVYTDPNNGSPSFYEYVYPKSQDMLQVQKNYINAYMDSFELALSGTNFSDPILGFRKYIDILAACDFIFINEMSRNVDAYRASNYFYKDKNSNDGRFVLGPVWDYNFAWRNADFCNSDQISGWDYSNYACAPKVFWAKRMVQDPWFQNRLQCRWQDLRANQLDTASINHFIDSVALFLNDAKSRHFAIWKSFGAVPNLYWPPPISLNYQQEISYMKT
ncbi:MAG: CotH kinase family protein [Bacteroidetes bacterium]|nr:CotH kinase family protein [Bacteroidota bacterium]